MRFIYIKFLIALMMIQPKVIPQFVHFVLVVLDLILEKEEKKLNENAQLCRND